MMVVQKCHLLVGTSLIINMFFFINYSWNNLNNTSANQENYNFNEFGSRKELSYLLNKAHQKNGQLMCNLTKNTFLETGKRKNQYFKN